MDATAWDERYAGTELVWSAGPNQFVEDRLAELPPGRGLDLACGEGRNARWLAAQGWQMTATDFSAVAVEKGRRRSEQEDDRIEWVVGDALVAPLPADLDLVVIAYLQLPAEQRTTVVRRAFDALRSGGRLLVVAHDSTNLTQGTGGPQDPAVLYTAEDVLDDLTSGLAGEVGGASFEVLEAGRVRRDVAGPDEHGSTGTAWDALVHLTRR